MNPEVSVVLPIYNEASTLLATVDLLHQIMHEMNRTYELVLVDDGSIDDTGMILDQMRDSRVVAVHFSRNFGKEAAMLAGMEAARGAAVVIVDADMQHPLQLIPQMVALWEQGWEVVEGIKERRGREPLVYRVLTRLFYGLMGKSAGQRLRNSSDFKLLDRQVVAAICSLPERNRFFRGLIAWVGFRVTSVPFEVQPRLHGETKWSGDSLIRYAIRNLVSFTAFPLWLISGAGFVTIVLAMLLGIQTLANWYMGRAVTGFTTVILSVLGLGGAILFSLGVVALYLAQMYDEMKRRPIYIVRRERGAGPESQREDDK